MRFLSLLVLVGCSTTIESSWHSPDLTPRHLKTFAVFGSARELSTRVAFERALTTGLRARGLDAKPGYDFIADDPHVDLKEIVAKMKEKGIEAVLITRVMDQKTEVDQTQISVPYAAGRWGNGFNAGWYGYWAPLPVATQVIEETTYYCETALYEVDNQEPLWVARSSTTRTKPAAFARDLTGVVARELKDAGIAKR